MPGQCRGCHKSKQVLNIRCSMQEARDGREVPRGNTRDRGDGNSSQQRCLIIAGWAQCMGPQGAPACAKAWLARHCLLTPQGSRERGAWQSKLHTGWRNPHWAPKGT